MTVRAPFRTQVTVTGMTCGHCVAAVTEEVGGIDGVRAVDVALETGVATVLSDREVARVEIAAAVDEAGYELAD